MAIKTISNDLYYFVQKIQKAPELNNFALTGGTNLAIRFDHRVSVDIDLFSNKLIGIERMESIAVQLISRFKKFNPTTEILRRKDNRTVWFQFFVTKNNNKIKMDIIQNIAIMFPIEKVNGIKMFSVLDVALLKLDSMLDRGSLKDMYDLNYITDNIISLPELWKLYNKKLKRFTKYNDINTFTYRRTYNPINFPEALADIKKEFNPVDTKGFIQHQSHLPDVNKAYSQWKKKVNSLVLKLKSE